MPSLQCRANFPVYWWDLKVFPLQSLPSLLFFVTMKIDLRWKNDDSSDGGGGSSSGGGLALWLLGCSYYIY